MKITIGISMLACLAGVYGCQSMPVAENAAKLGVSFTWPVKPGCSSVSPEIKVSNAPAGARYLTVKMTDLNVPSYPHGGGDVAYPANGVIPAGVLKSYDGPRPPMGAHSYEIVVKALNAEKNLILGEGKASGTFRNRFRTWKADYGAQQGAEVI